MSKKNLMLENKAPNITYEKETVQVHKKHSLPDLVMKRNSDHIVDQPINVRQLPTTIRKPSVAAIAEENEDEDAPRRFKRSGSATGSHSSYIRKDLHRSSSRITTDGLDNLAFSRSTESSLHGGSVKSLPVMREQYCCCEKWSPLERNLLKAVAILAIVILALVVAVGLLAKHSDSANILGGKKLMWSL